MNKKLQIQTLVWTTMKMSFQQLFLCLLFCGFSYAHKTHGQDILSKSVSIEVEGAEIRKILSLIEKQAGVRFIYSSSAINTKQKVSIKAVNKKLESVLGDLLNPISISYAVTENRILLKSVKNGLGAAAPAEIEQTLTLASVEQIVTGTVIDENKAALPGVSILVKGTQKGTATYANGNFRIEVPTSNDVLIFSFVGYLPQEIKVGSQSVLNVTLSPDIKALGEVVVVGYGTQNKAEVTGSIASLNTKTIKDMPVANIGEGIAGRMPGVLVQQASGAPGSGPSIKIRGLGSISAGNGPLFVIDGQPLNSGDLVNGSSLSLLNPNDIETVDVLKDASATAIFGSRGANGVIVITTKRGKAGKSTLSFDYYTGVQQVSKKMDLLNSQQFADLSKEATNNAYVERVSGANAADPNAVRPAGLRYRYPRGEYLGINFDNPQSLAYYDYQDLIFQSAPISSYQLSASGGSDKVQYMISGNYLKQDGVIKRSGIDRFTFRSNIDAQLTSKVKVGMRYGLFF